MPYTSDVVDECPTHLFDYRLDISEIPSITVRINESIAFSLIIQPQILALNICTPCH